MKNENVLEKIGKNKSKIRIRHFAKVSDLTKEEIENLIERGLVIKKTNFRSNLLKGKNIALMFEKPSTRTRVAFEVAINHLGGSPIYLDHVTTQLTRGEPMKDFIRVMNRYVDALIVRMYKHSDLDELIRYSEIPIINGLTDLEHPCQALSDLMTLKEFNYLDSSKTLAFYGDANFNVANSLLYAVSLFKLKIKIVSPKKYASNEEYLKLIKKNTKVEIIEDPIEGAKDVDIFYTDTWISMGIEHEKADRIRELMQYQLSDTILSNANSNAIVMLTCL
ncbi:MAG: hypothetical protein QXF76_03195 [Candidatus Anstonellales archaeon]